MFGKRKKEIPSAVRNLHHRHLSVISVRLPGTTEERIIGRDGVINISERELVIVCQNEEVFRAGIDHLEVAELMSRDGFTMRDRADTGAGIVTAHYVK